MEAENIKLKKEMKKSPRFYKTIKSNKAPIILDKSLGGPDATFSLDEKEFSDMVKAVRQAEMSIGNIDYKLTEKQIKGRDFSRSLYIVKDLKKGEILNEKNWNSNKWWGLWWFKCSSKIDIF